MTKATLTVEAANELRETVRLMDTANFMAGGFLGARDKDGAAEWNTRVKATKKKFDDLLDSLTISEGE